MRSALREPRFNDHPDRGCSLHPSCLECPRAQCRYDEVKSVRRPPLGVTSREENIRQQRELGASITQLMSEFGLANRTIHRIIAGASAKAD